MPGEWGRLAPRLWWDLHHPPPGQSDRPRSPACLPPLHPQTQVQGGRGETWGVLQALKGAPVSHTRLMTHIPYVTSESFAHPVRQTGTGSLRLREGKRPQNPPPRPLVPLVVLGMPEPPLSPALSGACSPPSPGLRLHLLPKDAETRRANIADGSVGARSGALVRGRSGAPAGQLLGSQHHSGAAG